MSYATRKWYVSMVICILSNSLSTSWWLDRQTIKKTRRSNSPIKRIARFCIHQWFAGIDQWTALNQMHSPVSQTNSFKIKYWQMCSRGPRWPSSLPICKFAIEIKYYDIDKFESQSLVICFSVTDCWQPAYRWQSIMHTFSKFVFFLCLFLLLYFYIDTYPSI